MTKGTNKKQENKQQTSSTSTLTSISGSMAAMFIQTSLEKGKKIEIPSLQITLGQTHVPQNSQDTSNGSKSDKKKSSG